MVSAHNPDIYTLFPAEPWLAQKKREEPSKSADHTLSLPSRFLFPFHCHGSNNIINQAPLDSIFKSRDITLPTKVHLVNGFSSGHVWMWELDYKEDWAPKNWCFWTVVLEKTLESPLDSREIKPVNPKENQP